MNQKQGILILFLLITPFLALSQVLTNGCDEANFGVDADVNANGSQFGSTQSNQNNTDDWFYNPGVYLGSGVGIIDTTGAFQMQQALQSGANNEMLIGMSIPLNSLNSNGTRNLDAIYARDQYGGTQATDNTAYTSASKNGENPEIWNTGPMNVTPKNDLIDCYGHLRRNGAGGTDDLWLFTSFSRVANTGSSYFDVELYASDIYYNGNNFISGGTEGGHTTWKFDANGNIIQVGDFVVSVDFSTGTPPELELRIWVSENDYNNANPQTFSFGNEYDGAGPGSPYGYANIQPPLSGIYGCGVGNPNTTFGPPWGTLNSGGNYSFTYENNQLVDIGVNLNAFGIDPALALNYPGSNPCEVPFSAIVFKARASSSFTAQLKDFAGPYPFGVIVDVPTDINADTITCKDPIVELGPATVVTDAYYHWETTDGNIISNPDSSHILVDVPGTYYFFGSPSIECSLSTDTIVVAENLIYPTALITADTVFGCGNSPAHLVGSPNGLLYEWFGPNGFTSAAQEVDVVGGGQYILVTTDPVSLCQAQDTVYLPDGPCLPIFNNPEIPDDGNTVILIDDIPPVVVFPPNVTIDCNDDPFDFDLTGEIISATDNCGNDLPPPYYLDSPATDTDCGHNQVILRIWYQPDNCGNTTFHIQEIILADQTPPSFTVPADIYISCDDPTDVTVTGDVTTESDDCDPTIGEATFTDEIITVNSCSGSSEIIRTWTLEDRCGNVHRDTQRIYLQDEAEPIFTVPADLTISCDQDPDDLTITGDVIDETDDCDGNIGQAIYNDVLENNFGCVGSARIVRTWTLTDNCGNTSSETQYIILQDDTPPIFTAPADLIISCDQDPDDLNLTGTITIMQDNCDNNLAEPTYTDVVEEDQPCSGARRISRTWRMVDGCGNEQTNVQIIVLEDQTLPSFTPPADITIYCPQDPTDLTLTGDVYDASDNCDLNNLQATYTDVVTSIPCGGESEITRTWSLTDACGNIQNATQTIMVRDTTAPFFLNFPPFGPSTTCDSITPIPVVNVDFTVDDYCGDPGNITITFSETKTPGSCASIFSLRRVWVAVDECGNMDSISQVLQIDDTSVPVVLTFPPDLTISCDSMIPSSAPVVIDNCDQSPTYSFVETITPGDCLNNENIERVWTWADNCGNANMHTQYITKIDDTPPVFTVPGDVTIGCTEDAEDLNNTGTPTNITDNCQTLNLIPTYKDSIVSDFGCQGTSLIVRVWSVVDNCGNVNEQIQRIILEDNEVPQFTVPVDLTLDCGSDINDLTLTGDVNDESDQCDPAIGEAVYRDSVALNVPCSGSSMVYRTWSLTDGCGNQTTQLQRITLVDTTTPVFTVPIDITISCTDDPSDLNLTGDVIDESDDCNIAIGQATYQDSIVTETICAANKTIFRKWTLIDACGNDTSQIQLIQITDTKKPGFTPPADIELTCDVDVDDLSITGNVTNEQDDCNTSLAAATYTDSLGMDQGCEGTAIIYRKWTLSDACGNDSMAVQIITRIDDTPPDFMVPDFITLDCHEDINDTSITGTVTMITDNCDTTGITIHYEDLITPSNLCAGPFRIVRTWTLTDGCGNAAEKKQFIRFIDTIPPTFSAPPDLALNCETDINDLTITGMVMDTTDNCGAGSLSISYQDSLVLNPTCSGNSTIYRTWIASDDCGNTSTDQQILTLEDNQLPTFIVPEDRTLECNTDINNLILTGSIIPTTDNCSDPLINTSYQDSIVLNGLCIGTGTIYRSWNVMDNCGNDTTVFQVITLVDELPPVFYSPSDTVIHCEVDHLDLGITGVPVEAYDHCDQNLGTPTYRDTIIVDTLCANNIKVLRTWELADACGNLASYLQIITKVDTIRPNFTAPIDIIISCTEDPDDLTITGEATSITDNCDDLIMTPTYRDSIIPSINCGNEKQIYRQWSLEDACGNDTTYWQLIQIIDTIPPTFTFTPDSIILNCGETIPVDSAIAIDICGGMMNMSFTDSLYAGDCAEMEFLNRTWTATDECGNTSTYIQLITLLNCGPEYSIDLGPASVICEGASITFTAIADSLYVPAVFQWEYRTDSLSNWTPIIGANSISLNIDSASLIDSGYYRILIADNAADLSNLDCQTISDETYLTVLIPPLVTELSARICQGDEYRFGNQIYTTADIYSDTLPAFNGCDSIVNLDLTVLLPKDSTLSEILCFGETWTVGNNTYDQSGSYVDTLTAFNTCDSIVSLNLTILPEIDTSLVGVICEGEIYTSAGIDYNMSGLYQDTITAFNGCDSIVVLDLTVLTHTIIDLDSTLCFGSSLMVGSSTYDQTGNYVDTLMRFNGCDSIVRLNLVILSQVENILTETICNGDVWRIGNIDYTATGNHRDTLTGFNGCDSIVDLTLTVLPLNTTDLNEVVCYGETWTVGNNTYDQSGSYVDTLAAFNTCDSIVSLNLTILPEIDTSLVGVICEGDVYRMGGNDYTMSGIYRDTVSAFNSCDSIIELTLTVVNQIENDLDERICYGDNWVVGSSTYTESGTYVDTLLSFNGCDSIVRLELLVLPQVENIQVETICSGAVWTVGGVDYDDSGNYRDTLIGFNGCDSIVDLTLTVLLPNATNLNETLCFGGTWTVGNNTYDQSGNYLDTLIAFNGCDSIVALELEIYPYNETEREATICIGDSLRFGDNYYSQTGNYIDTLASYHGCDSISKLILTVNTSINTTIDTIICEGMSYSFGGTELTDPGTYRDTLVSYFGCDSISTLSLIVNPEYQIDFDTVICQGELFKGIAIVQDTIIEENLLSIAGCDSVVITRVAVFPVYRNESFLEICEGASIDIFGTARTEAGSYTDTLTSISGCDSILVTELTVHPVHLDSIELEICAGDSILLGGMYLFGGENFTENGSSINGCDSITYYEVFEVDTIRVFQDYDICPGEVVIVNNNPYTEEGTFIETLLNTSGCDSIIVLEIRFKEVFYQESVTPLCTGDSVLIGGIWVTEPGIYRDTIISAEACDSIFRIELIATVPVFTNRNFEICQGDSLDLEGQIYRSDTSFTEVFIGHNGCDSAATTILAVRPVYENEIDVQICESDSAFIMGAYRFESGTFTDSTSSILGCDSTTIYQLTVHPEYYFESMETICEGETIPFNGRNISATGRYEAFYTTRSGCDSTVVLFLSVENTYRLETTETICEGEEIIINGVIQTTSGVYRQNLTTVAGCDSLIIVNLFVSPKHTMGNEHLICEGDSLLIGTEYYYSDTLLQQNLVNQFGCDSIVIETLEVEPRVDLFAGDEQICEGDSVQLWVDGADMIRWSPTTGLSCTDCPNPMASPAQTTTYQVSADNCLGTEANYEVTVFVNEIPRISVEPFLEALPGDSVSLFYQVTEPDAIITWFTSSNDTLCYNNCPDILEVMATHDLQYMITAVDEMGCKDEAVVTLDVKTECVYANVFIPNFITPNNDGSNDDFKITEDYVQELSLLRIYNRWGELVFESTDISGDRWDGTFRGKLVNPGVFVYYLEGICLNGEQLLIKGNLTVIR